MMSRLLNKEKTELLSKKALLGLVLFLLAPFAAAQNNLGELLDGGAKKVSPEEFREEVVQRMIVGPSPFGARWELMYATSGVIQGRADATGGGGNPNMPIRPTIDGVWTIDDRGRVCESIKVGSMLPFRCQYWFKFKDDYFIADSDDRSAKILRRTVKQ